MSTPSAAANGCTPAPAGSASSRAAAGEIGARGGDRRRGLVDGRRGRPDDLELRRGHLRDEARVPVEAVEDLARSRREVVRDRVEEHELLLDPDRQRRVGFALEGAPQVCRPGHAGNLAPRCVS
jgi:hypothetical protein